MKHRRPTWDTDIKSEWAVGGWRRCHSQLVWNAIGLLVGLSVLERAWEESTCRGRR